MAGESSDDAQTRPWLGELPDSSDNNDAFYCMDSHSLLIIRSKGAPNFIAQEVHVVSMFLSFMFASVTAPFEIHMAVAAYLPAVKYPIAGHCVGRTCV